FADALDLRGDGTSGRDPHLETLLSGDEWDPQLSCRTQVGPEKSRLHMIEDEPVPRCSRQQRLAGDAQKVGEPAQLFGAELRTWTTDRIPGSLSLDPGAGGL